MRGDLPASGMYDFAADCARRFLLPEVFLRWRGCGDAVATFPFALRGCPFSCAQEFITRRQKLFLGKAVTGEYFHTD